MRTRTRTRAAAVVVTIVAGVVLALFATSGPAVAFFSGGLFLDIRVTSPATLVARGAAVDVPLEVTCNTPEGAFVFVTVTQHSGSGVAQGSRSTSVGCTGSGQQIVVRVSASSGGKTFKQGTAVADAEIFGCRPGVCGTETDSEAITIQR
jgi:hypothetical protein